MIHPRTSVQLLLRIKVMRLTSINCCLPHPNFASNARTTSRTYLNHSESMLARSRPAKHKKSKFACPSGRWSCRKASGHQVGCRAPNRKAPSTWTKDQLHTHDFKEKSWNHGKKVSKSRKRTMTKRVPLENRWECWFLPVREVPWVTRWSVWFLATRDMCALVNMMASTSKKCHSM